MLYRIDKESGSNSLKVSAVFNDTLADVQWVFVYKSVRNEKKNTFNCKS